MHLANASTRVPVAASASIVTLVHIKTTGVKFPARTAFHEKVGSRLVTPPTFAGLPISAGNGHRPLPVHGSYPRPSAGPSFANGRLLTNRDIEERTRANPYRTDPPPSKQAPRRQPGAISRAWPYAPPFSSAATPSFPSSFDTLHRVTQLLWQFIPCPAMAP